MLLADYSPRTWRGTAFGAKCVLSLGISALAVPMVALIYEFTGFFWLFVIPGCLAATVVVAVLLLPADKQTVVGMAALRVGLAPARECTRILGWRRTD